ncbi:transporter [Verrucomicrobiota bacterium sgz303538]
MKLHSIFFLLLLLAVHTLEAGTPLSSASASASANSVRPFYTDRPDTTESAYTVPAGMFQVEATLFSYARDTFEGERTETFTWGGLNLKYGLARNTDLQLLFDLYTEERVTSGSSHDSTGAFSDITLRLKQNILGNDTEGLAVALMPYVKTPTGTALSNDEWEGGLIVPFGLEAVKDVLTVNWMLEGDVVYNEDKLSHEFVLVHSISLAWSLQKLGLENAGVFTEYVGEVGAGPYRAYANTGVTYLVAKNVQLDAAVNFGLTEESTDFTCFTGISFRF